MFMSQLYLGYSIIIMYLVNIYKKWCSWIYSAVLLKYDSIKYFNIKEKEIYLWNTTFIK
jgi:hypothetical protein